MKKYIEYDKDKLSFHVNFYFDDVKLVLKTPLHSERNQERETEAKSEDHTIQKFELSNKVYLSSI